jgi:hypothetical protein
VLALEVFQMTDADLKELCNRLNSIKERLDILIKLTALNIGKDTYFKNKERKDEKIEALATLEIPDKIVALIVGSSPESVQVLRSKLKSKKRSVEKKSKVEEGNSK